MERATEPADNSNPEQEVSLAQEQVISGYIYMPISLAAYLWCLSNLLYHHHRHTNDNPLPLKVHSLIYRIIVSYHTGVF